MTKILGLRTCDADGTSYNDFQWPLEVGTHVECPDWSPKPCCGYGLHFLPWGVGRAALLSNDASARWLVIEADESDVVAIADDGGGKSKCRACKVVYVGNRPGAVAYLQERAPAGLPIVFGTATAGARGTATAGYAGTATAGDAGTATAGARGTATAGYAGTATAGDDGTATAGDDGTATAGARGTATAGDDGTATAGYAGTATAGARGTATAGDAGTATAGDDGSIAIRYWDKEALRYRLRCADIGYPGVHAGVPYRINEETGQLVVDERATSKVLAGLERLWGLR